MKHILQSLLLTLSFLLVGVGNVWGETYAITFKTSSSDGNTTIAANANPDNVISSGKEYVSGFTSNCSKAYYACIGGIKLGSSSANGTVEFKLADICQRNIKSITLVSGKYNEDNNTRLELQADTKTLSSSIVPGTEYIHTFESPTSFSTINIKTTEKRAYISQIIITTEDIQETPEEDILSEYALFSGELTEGDYVIVDNGIVMKNAISSDRLSFASVTISQDKKITNPDESIVWHISQHTSQETNPDWKIYNAAINKYAAGTGSASKATLESDGTLDKSLWAVSGNGTYNFTNRLNTTKGVNATLRYNSGYGFACYSTATGHALQLYKKIETEEMYTITVTSTSGGIASSNPRKASAGTTIQLSAAANTNYNFTSWTVVDIDGNAIQTIPGIGNTCSFTMPASNVTVNAIFTPKDAHNVIWSVNKVQTATSCAEGGTINFGRPAFNIPDGYEFMGWVAEDFEGTRNTAPTYTTSATMGKSDVTFYAVFARKNFDGIETIFDASKAETNQNLSWTQDGVTLKLSAGQLYTSGTPKTFTVTKGQSNYFSITSASYDLNTITAEVSGTNYVIGSVSNGNLTTDGTTQIITTQNNIREIKGYATSSNQIRLKTINVIAGTISYSDYCTYVNTSIRFPSFSYNPKSVETTLGEPFTQPELTNNSDGEVSYSSSNNDVATVDNEGNVTILAAGTAIITASVSETSDYHSATASYSLIINKKNATLLFPRSEYTVDINADFQEPELTRLPTDANVTYSSSNENVATVNENTGGITLKAEGTTIITAMFAGNETYEGATASYSLTIIDNSVKLYVFERVTDVRQLMDGGDYVITNRGGTRALGISGGNNRESVPVDAFDNTNNTVNSIIVRSDRIASGTSTKDDNHIAIINVVYNYENNNQRWCFYDEPYQGYLYADKAGKNSIGITSNYDDDIWATISISGNEASVIFETDVTTNKNFRYNTQSEIFSCYVSGQQGIALFKKTEQTLRSITLWDTSDKRDAKYERNKVEHYDEIHYVREFKNDNWQALYVPFSMKVEELGTEYKIAALNNMHQYDDDGDGVLDDKLAMEVDVLKSGTLKPNHPYLIRYTGNTGNQTITVKDADLFPAEDTQIDCASMNRKYTFTGNYAELSELMKRGAYFMSGGGLRSGANDTDKLSCYRWYMTMSDLDDQILHLGDMPAEIKIFVNGVWDETSIASPDANNTNDTWIDLCGVHHTGKPRPGIYLHNGRKVIVR